ncbi:MAG TPA: hypothetical protein IAC41_06530 [Candidatus Merdenecus merdavium]|nr:hypothetical protein [Candidatus Merdenecus merdavium]
MSLEDVKATGTGESSKTIGKRVIKAQRRQTKRYEGTEYQFNSDLDSSGVEKYCILGKKEEKMMELFYQKWNLSLRSYHKILKVALTIADLAEEDHITEKHLIEALCYRTLDKKYWT